jgi:acyl-CoA dehydrogenase
MDNTGDLLRDTAAKLFAAHTEPRALAEAEQGTWPTALWDAIAEAGLDRALVPEDAGGFGVAVTDALHLLRVAGEHALPVPLAETMLASYLLAGAGLPIPSTPLTVAPVIAGKPLHLTPDGRIEGEASRVPWARTAGISLALLVERDTQSFVALLPPGSWHSTPAENWAREPRDTIRVSLRPEHIAPAASGISPLQLQALGAAMRSLQIAGALTQIAAMTTQYAQERVQFGRPIGKFQAVQQNLAILAGQAAAAVAAADLAAEAVADGIRLLPIAAAKSRTGEAAGIAAAIAHQVHGAIGFTYEHRLHFFTKRLWSWRDEFGNEAAWNLLLGQHLAQAGADRLWPELTAP